MKPVSPFQAPCIFSSQKYAEMYKLRFLNLKIKECGTMLNMAFLATPASKGCAPTAHAHCFQATAFAFVKRGNG